MVLVQELLINFLTIYVSTQCFLIFAIYNGSGTPLHISSYACFPRQIFTHTLSYTRTHMYSRLCTHSHVCSLIHIVICTLLYTYPPRHGLPHIPSHALSPIHAPICIFPIHTHMSTLLYIPLQYTILHTFIYTLPAHTFICITSYT